MTDASWLPEPVPALPPPWRPSRARRTSRYLTMRDGARIAIEVYLPETADPHLRGPTILRQTRYMRALAPRFGYPLSLASRAFDLYARTRQVFLAAGYAWVDVDARGSGASSGTRPHPWTMNEIRDGGEIVDWIVREPWSDGRVGSLGISYDGTAAELLLANPNIFERGVRAVAPMFSLFDAYADVAFPGGIHLAWFTEAWARYNAALDRGAFGEASAHVVRLILRAAAVSPAPAGPDRLLALAGRLGELADPIVAALLRGLIAGVAPVGGAFGTDELRRAIAEHAGNFSVHEGAKKMDYRDDRGLSPATPDDTIDVMSPHHHLEAIRGSGAAIYGYSGFRDAAYPSSAIKRWRALGGRDRMTLGPWTHAGKQRIRPFDVAVAPSFDHDAELLAFFDESLNVKRRGSARSDGHRVHYFTFVEERWKSAASWPPPATPLALYVGDDRRLTEVPKARAGDDALAVDPDFGTGERSRWRSLLSMVPGDYPDRRERDRQLLTFDGAPLDRDLEVTGHPVVTLFASWDGDDDGRLFAYLEDIAPDGRVAYVSEGQLRAVHRQQGGSLATNGGPLLPTHSFRRGDAMPLAARTVGELAFELYPISWRFLRGHRVRVAVAGGDGDHFVRSRATTLRIHRGPDHPSRIELPIVGDPR